MRPHYELTTSYTTHYHSIDNANIITHVYSDSGTILVCTKRNRHTGLHTLAIYNEWNTRLYGMESEILEYLLANDMHAWAIAKAWVEKRPCGRLIDNGSKQCTGFFTGTSKCCHPTRS